MRLPVGLASGDRQIRSPRRPGASVWLRVFMTSVSQCAPGHPVSPALGGRTAALLARRLTDPSRPRRPSPARALRCSRSGSATRRWPTSTPRPSARTTSLRARRRRSRSRAADRMAPHPTLRSGPLAPSVPPAALAPLPLGGSGRCGGRLWPVRGRLVVRLQRPP